MLKKLIFLLSCGMFLFFAACQKACDENNKTKTNALRIGTNANFPPFETIDNKGQLVGFDIDVGRALGETLNRPVEFREFDFDALILALKEGQIDLIMAGMSITSSRQKEIAMLPYQGKQLTEISFLFWQKAPEGIQDLKDIKRMALEKNLAISVQAGHFLEEFFVGEGIPTKPLPGPPEQILDIKYHKSLAAALDSSNAKTLAREHKNLKMITLPLPKEKWDLGNGIGIKKNNTELIKKIEQAIEELKKNGTIQSLEDKWIKDDK